jgi:hypothetical protein
VESKRSKRKTRDRTESSTSNSSGSKIKNKDDPSLTVKRKTLKSKKTSKVFVLFKTSYFLFSELAKTNLPMLTVTQASLCIDQGVLNEKDSTQLLLPASVSATSSDTSCESQPLKPRTKKQSRYPCRRAQRPVKQIDTSDQVEIEV